MRILDNKAEKLNLFFLYLELNYIIENRNLRKKTKKHCFIADFNFK